MIRAIFCALFAASAMSAGVLAGARYGLTTHNAGYDGESGGKNAWGGGLIAGYDFGEYRAVAAFESVGIKKSSELLTIGAHVITRADKYINPFLGIEAGRLGLRLENQPSKENVNVGGLAIGIILLDDRYKNAQMELGYKYLRAFGVSEDKLSVGNIHNFTIAILFNF